MGRIQTTLCVLLALASFAAETRASEGTRCTLEGGEYQKYEKEILSHLAVAQARQKAARENEEAYRQLISGARKAAYFKTAGGIVVYLGGFLGGTYLVGKSASMISVKWLKSFAELAAKAASNPRFVRGALVVEGVELPVKIGSLEVWLKKMSARDRRKALAGIAAGPARGVAGFTLSSHGVHATIQGILEDRKKLDALEAVVLEQDKFEGQFNDARFGWSDLSALQVLVQLWQAKGRLAAQEEARLSLLLSQLRKQCSEGAIIGKLITDAGEFGRQIASRRDARVKITGTSGYCMKKQNMPPPEFQAGQASPETRALNAGP